MKRPSETTDKSSRCVLDIETLQNTTEFIDPFYHRRIYLPKKLHPIDKMPLPESLHDRDGQYKNNGQLKNWIQCNCINQTSSNLRFSFKKSQSLQRFTWFGEVIMARLIGVTLTKDVTPITESSFWM